jgi:PAS domain S-box-containing protein
MIDNTESKKAEEAIRLSEEKYRTLVEQASDAIFIADSEGRFITVNSSACRLSRHSEAELLNMSIYDFVISDDLQKNPFHFDILKQGKTVITERIMKQKNGNTLLIEVNAKLLTDGRLLAFVRDISDRKKAELALKESENHLRTILLTEPECIKLLSKNGELEDMNPAGLAMIEADDIDQVKGKSILDIINKPYRKAFQNLNENVFKGKSGSLEFEITGLKGTSRWLSTNAVPMKDAEGNIMSLLGVTRDVTDRKKAEEEIKKTTEELRRLTAHLQKIREEERKRIGREIHDELGQQLTAIKMDVAWIDKKTPPETTVLKGKLKNIITLLDGSNKSIKRILSELRPGILDDYGLLEAIEWINKQFTSNTGIPVEFNTAETDIKLPDDFSTCIFRIYQEAFTNITRYARAKKVVTSLHIHDNKIEVRIKDDGIGFDPSLIQHRKSFGILGMKERILSLEGNFELESSPGTGTKIIIRLPYPESIKVNTRQ